MSSLLPENPNENKNESRKLDIITEQTVPEKQTRDASVDISVNSSEELKVEELDEVEEIKPNKGPNAWTKQEWKSAFKNNNVVPLRND